MVWYGPCIIIPGGSNTFTSATVVVVDVKGGVGVSPSTLVFGAVGGVGGSH